MAELKAVLFDLDDTLIDWSGFSGDYRALELPRFTALHSYYTGQGHILPRVETLLETFRTQATAGWERGRETMISPHLPKLLVEVLRTHGIPEAALDVTTIVKEYNWGKVEGTAVFPEVPQTLETLLGASVRIGIVTNAFQTMVMRDRELEQHDLLRYFKSCRFAAADVGYLKPHPAIFEAALACTGTRAEETVFVGDNLNADIVGAQRVGMKAVWRDTGYHSSRISRDSIIPDGTITALDQLLTLLDDWYEGWRPA